MSDDARLMVYNNQYLYKWHSNRLIKPNERLSEKDKKPVGYFTKHQGKWILVNQNLPELFDVINKKQIPIGKHVVLEDNVQLLLEKGNGGRLAIIQMVNK